MIIAKLIGGLGNQMFQYAAGRALAMRLGVPIFIDRRSFDKSYRLRHYGLGCFQIAAQDAPNEVLPQISGDGYLNRILRRWLPNAGMHIYQEKSFSYDSGFEFLDRNTYIEGYWQSERYFHDVGDQIRSDFTLIGSQSIENEVWSQRIGGSNSVSLHVRRGDYVSNPQTNQIHGTCDLGYYASAIAEIAGRVDREPEFFVFSDDPGWVRDNLPFGKFRHHFIENNDFLNCHEDLRLMASCKHHIIANSTFSWWGAWLNPSPEKIVIAPVRWFRDESMCDDDLIPHGWLRK